LQLQDHPAAQAELAPGQCAIIHNCPNARLNGERVILEKYNDLGEWTVKGDKFPLSVGMSLGAQFLQVTKPAQSSHVPQQAPTLLTGDAHRVTGKCKNSLRALLEKCNTAMMQGGRAFDDSNVRVSEYVSDVYVHAFAIINEASGLGASGQCPFASAYEVHLFYRFCLNVCVAWSEHSMGKDELLDKDFHSQMSDLAQILCFLDTTAVPLPEETERNIKVLQSDALFPHWVDAQTPKGEAALECCVSVGQKWGLEETGAFQKALQALEKVRGNQLLMHRC
jgi:hypothetical protein